MPQIYSSVKAQIVAAVVSAGMFLALPSAAQLSGSPGKNAPLQVIQIHPKFYMIAAAGSSNIAVQTVADGTVLIDAGTMSASDDVLSAIKQITDQLIHFAARQTFLKLKSLGLRSWVR